MVQALLTSTDEPVMLTDLGRAEMASAIGRLVRMEQLTEQEALLIEGRLRLRGTLFNL